MRSGQIAACTFPTLIAAAALVAPTAVNAEPLSTRVGALPVTTFCPQPDEAADGFRKLFATYELKFAMAAHDVGIGTEPPRFANPLSDISWRRPGDDAWQAMSPSPQVDVAYSAWWTWGAATESRTVTLTTRQQLTNGVPFEIVWQVIQQRPQGGGELATTDAEIIAIHIGDGDMIGPGLRLGRMVGDSVVCEQDMYQGEQPNTSLGGGQVIDNYREPYAITVSLQPLPLPNNVPAVTISGRTSMGGFDKTMFMAISKMEITGVLPRPIAVTRLGRVAHAAGHHNWSDQYVADVAGADDLSDAERADLLTRGISYLMVRPITTEEGQARGLDETWNVKVLESYDAQRTPREILGVMKEQRWETERSL